MPKSKRQELMSIARIVGATAVVCGGLGAILALLIAARLQRPKTVVNSR